MKVIQFSPAKLSIVAIAAALALVGLTATHIWSHNRVGCDEAISLAVARAKAHHKRLFVKFGSTWCRSCNELESFLKSPEVWAILGKYLEYESIHYDEDAPHKDLETPGVEDWMKKVGIKSALPSYAVLDSQGKVITSSTKPSRKLDLGSVYGEPFSYDDIARFLHLISEGCPDMSKDELMRFRSLMERDIQNRK